MTRRLIGGAALALVLARCSPFGSEVGATGASDAGLDASATTPDAGRSLGAADAGCYDFHEDFSSNALEGWTVLGAPSPTAFEGVRALELTAGAAKDERGAIWRQIPPSTSLQVDVDLLIDEPSSSAAVADGFYVSWAPASVAADDIVLGDSGSSLGLCPQPHAAKDAVGVGVFTYFQTSVGPRISVLDPTTSSCEGAPTKLPSSTVPHMMALSATVQDGQVSATVSGTTMSPQASPRTFPIGWVGFGAANGNINSRQLIERVRIHACP